MEKETFSERKGTLSAQVKTMFGLGQAEILYYAATSCLAPFFSKEAELKGVSISMIGIIFVAPPLALIVASPFLGTLVSYIGARKTFFLGSAISGCSYIVFGFLNRIESEQIFSVSCILCRIASGLGSLGICTNVIFFAKTFPNEINKAMGLNEIFAGLGICVGPILGGLLYDLGGFSLPFWCLGTVQFCLMPISAICLPQVDDEKLERSESTSHTILKILKSPAILLNLLATIVFACGWTFLEPILEPEFRKEFGVSSSFVAAIFFVMAVSYTISGVIMGGIADQLHQEKVWTLTFIGCSGCAFAVLLLDPSLFFNFPDKLWIKFACLGSLGMFVAIGLVPTYAAMIKDVTDRGFPDDSATYGTISGLWNSVYALGEITGPGLGAIVTEHFTFGTTCSMTSVVFFAVAALYFFYFNSKSKSTVRYRLLQTADSEATDVEAGLPDFKLSPPDLLLTLPQ